MAQQQHFLDALQRKERAFLQDMRSEFVDREALRHVDASTRLSFLKKLETEFATALSQTRQKQQLAHASALEMAHLERAAKAAVEADRQRFVQSKRQDAFETAKQHAQLVAERQSMEQQKAAVQKEVAATEKQFQSLREKMSAHPANEALSNKALLERKVAVLQAEKATLQRQMEELRAQGSSMKLEHAQLQSEKQRLRDQIKAQQLAMLEDEQREMEALRLQMMPYMASMASPASAIPAGDLLQSKYGTSHRSSELDEMRSELLQLREEIIKAANAKVSGTQTEHSEKMIQPAPPEVAANSRPEKSVAPAPLSAQQQAELDRLRSEQKTLLSSGAYSEEDDLLKMLQERILALTPALS